MKQPRPHHQPDYARRQQIARALVFSFKIEDIVISEEQVQEALKKINAAARPGK